MRRVKDWFGFLSSPFTTLWGKSKEKKMGTHKNDLILQQRELQEDGQEVLLQSPLWQELWLSKSWQGIINEIF